MKIKDIFKDIHKGTIVEEEGNPTGRYIYPLDTSNISNGVIDTSKKDVIEEKYKYINDKHILHKDDIVIASVPSLTTSHVGYASSVPSEYLVVLKKQIIVLRNIIPEYNPLFISEYLEKIGIKDFYTKNGKPKTYSLLMQDIEDIEIPNVSIEQQEKIVDLLEPINRRTSYCKQLIENDNQLIEYLLKQVINND